jgi:uncharacterized membrane protein
MADFSGLISFAPELLRSLPQIFQTVQLIAYILFMFFFGSIVIRGFRGYLPWHVKLLARMGLGFLTLVCAVSLAPFMPFGGTGVFRLMFTILQADIWIAGVISALVLAVSLFLISSRFYNIKAMEKSMEKLKAKLEKAKAVGKEEEGKTFVQRILQPMRLAGIVIFVGFLVIALISFKGFPDTTGNILSAIGLTPQDIENLTGYIEAISPSQESMPEGCVSPLELAQNFQESIIRNDLPVYADPAIRNLIESNSAGEKVALIYRIEYKQRTYALAITDRQSICSATGDLFCGCVNLGSLA